MSKEYTLQRHLDIYFEELAKEHLPDPEKWPSSSFQGYHVCFGKREVKSGAGRHEVVIVHKDDVAGHFQPKSEPWGVKVKFLRKSIEDDAGNTAWYWDFVTVVYKDLDAMEQAYSAMVSAE